MRVPIPSMRQRVEGGNWEVRQLVRGIAYLAFLIVFMSAPARAHEFWLEVTDFSPKASEPISVTHFVGQKFKGDSFPYVREWYQRYALVNVSGKTEIDGVDGNDPAVKLVIEQPGLAILTYLSKPNAIDFQTWQKYEKYLNEEGLESFKSRHRSQGKPDININELYTRCAKALIGVEDGKGSDRPIGMPLELVAIENPYTLAPGKPMAVRLLYNGAPVKGVLVKVFDKNKPEEPLRLRTNKDGRVEFQLKPSSAYLLNAVHMVEPDQIKVNGRTFHWQSFWASLTFERP